MLLSNPSIFAMQQQGQAQNIQACVRSLKTNSLLQLAKAIRAERVDMNVAMQVLPQELRVPLNKLVTVDLAAKELDDEARKAEGILGNLNAISRGVAYRLICNLLSIPIKTIDDLLLEVALQGDINTIKIVLEAGADPNFIKNLKINDRDLYKTPLLTAMDAPVDAETIQKLIRLLLEAGADPTLSPSFFSDPPLVVAITKKQPLLVETLLNAGAPVNTDFLSITPLMVAAEHGTPEIVALLLRHGADRTRTDMLGRIALNYATDPAIRQLLTA